MMFLLVLIGVPVLEVFVFIEVGSAIGWLAAVVLLLATSVLGARLLRIQGRATIERVTRAVSERRSPARGTIDGLLGFLGGGLLLTPGFVTDAMGALLLLPVTRRLAARWISRHYAGRVVRFVAVTGQVVSAGPRTRPADVDSTAVEHEPDQLGS
jgi:UPF0716 protein FxsA